MAVLLLGMGEKGEEFFNKIMDAYDAASANKPTKNAEGKYVKDNMVVSQTVVDERSYGEREQRPMRYEADKKMNYNSLVTGKLKESE